MALTAKLVCWAKSAADSAGMVSISFRADYTDTGNKTWSPSNTPNLGLNLTVPSAAAGQFVLGSKYTLALGASATGGSVPAGALSITLT